MLNIVIVKKLELLILQVAVTLKAEEFKIKLTPELKQGVTNLDLTWIEHRILNINYGKKIAWNNRRFFLDLIHEHSYDHKKVKGLQGLFFHLF